MADEHDEEPIEQTWPWVLVNVQTRAGTHEVLRMDPDTGVTWLLHIKPSVDTNDVISAEWVPVTDRE